MMIFFAMLFSIGGIYGFACFAGSTLGGFSCGLAIFPGIRNKDMVIMLAGIGGIVVYWLTMFLIFYLAV
jgi:LytS/YehU family sensor histidine kinase